MSLSSVGIIPYRRLTDPLKLPYGPVSQRTKVPAKFIPPEATSFRVTNTGTGWVRLRGANSDNGNNPATLTINNDQGWLFPPGFSGTFTTQFPEYMATISPDGATGVLEITYGIGGSGESVGALMSAGGATSSSVVVANTPLPVAQDASPWGVTVGNFPATQTVTGTVSVGNFPATQPISGTVGVSGSVAVTGTFWQATQPVSGTVTVGNASIPATQSGTWNVGITGAPAVTVANFPATQAVSGAVSVSNFPATQAISGTVSVGNFPATQQVGDNAGSLTVDTGTPGVFALTPSSLAANAIVPIRNTAAASLVLKNTAGNLYSAYSVAGNTGYILMALDRIAVPAAGGAIAAADIISMAQVPANGYATISPPDIPDRFVNGCVLIATTSLTTFTAPQNLPFFNRGKVA